MKHSGMIIMGVLARPASGYQKGRPLPTDPRFLGKR